MQEQLELASAVARDAGAIMRASFGLGATHRLKDDRSPITEADERINQLVIERIGAAYPDHGFIGEEGSKAADSGCTWVFDPIDGTAPYVRGIPTNVFALALVEDGVPLLGVVYDPYLDRLYHAVRGEGAFMNGMPIHVRTTTDFKESYVEMDGHGGIRDLAFLQQLRDADVRLLSYSSTVYAHMLVASGQIEAAIFPRKRPWDAAAAKVIIEEAGGVTSSIDGKEQRYDREINGFVSACTHAFHEKLLALIAPSL